MKVKFELTIHGDEDFYRYVSDALEVFGVKPTLRAYRKDKLKWVLDCEAGFGVLAKVKKGGAELVVHECKIEIPEEGKVVITQKL